jgi:hypothetical protein
LFEAWDHFPGLAYKSGTIPVIGADPRPPGRFASEADWTVGADLSCGARGQTDFWTRFCLIDDALVFASS